MNEKIRQAQDTRQHMLMIARAFEIARGDKNWGADGIRVRKETP